MKSQVGVFCNTLGHVPRDVSARSQSAPGAPPESAPSHRALEVAPILVRIRAVVFGMRGQVLAQLVRRNGAICNARCDDAD